MNISPEVTAPDATTPDAIAPDEIARTTIAANATAPTANATNANAPTANALSAKVTDENATDAYERASKAKPIRVLIADDHAVVLEGLCALIGRQSDMCVVAQAANGRDAVTLAQRLRPDITLLDLRMPLLDGVGVIKVLCAGATPLRVIVLTTYDTDENIYRALKAGAKSYLLKDARREQLLDCIRRVHAGQTWIPPEVAARLAERTGSDALSKRESEVLNLLARGHSNREIAQSLFISETTVKSHLKNLFAKLKVLSRTEAVAVAAQSGLIEL